MEHIKNNMASPLAQAFLKLQVRPEQMKALVEKVNQIDQKMFQVCDYLDTSKQKIKEYTE